MKTASNIPIPKSARWKEGETVIYVNHVDNGIQPEEQEGRRYEADFTIVKGEEAEDAIYAFTRMTEEPEFDQKVIDNIEVDGKPAIDKIVEYPTKVSTTIFPSLPSMGWLNKGDTYSYNNGAVMVVQSHERTIYTPEETPALFSFYRDNAAALEWMAGEKVEVGWTRMYEGKKYECLQAHQTLSTWTPDVMPALWKLAAPATNEWAYPVSYSINQLVTYQGSTYKCLQAHTSQAGWTPPVVPALWQLV